MQPNRIEHFLRLARRLGREILEWVEFLAIPASSWPVDECVREQLDDLEESIREMQQVTIEDREALDLSEDLTKATLDLKTLALDLDEYAPDLANEAGFDWSEEVEEPDPANATKGEVQRWKRRQSEYGALLQMQILEEINNNWESRFPEDEHVWDFATSRVEPKTRTLPDGKEMMFIPKPKQFFSMHGYSFNCHTEQTQKRMTESDPSVATKPVPPVRAPPKTRQQIVGQAKQAKVPKKKKARHIRGREPHFPFGETTYQAAWLSHRMEQDLKDGKSINPYVLTATDLTSCSPRVSSPT